MIHYLKKITSWLLPFYCLLCGESSNRQQDLCAACYQTLPFVKKGCERCAAPLTIDSICGTCLKVKNLPFQTVHALFQYEWPITHLILKLKFQHSLIVARLLGELLADKIKYHWYQTKPLPDLIIPIPLHSQRLKERGFNQALEIARPIATTLNRPLLTKNCWRMKPTLAQATLSQKMRQTNIQHAFKIDYPLKNLSVAVIDDVMTTGATVFEFCQVLKKAGVATIDVWSLARSNFL